jgi:multiple sugar transport system ATP-binding protein
MAEIKLTNVVKRFGKVTAVEQVNLLIQDKEFLVLVGPSGCGKTTTLRMIAGLEDLTEGEIYIGNRKVNDVSPKDRDIAMVFQNYALYPHMNVYKNMAFGLRLRKFLTEEIFRRVRESAKILGIEELLERKPKELSGGQRQRVAMGRAIVRKPQAFLFDEPLSNLDAKLRVQMRGELKKLHDRLETTSVYVTHDQIEAMTIADRIVVMDKGCIMQMGHPLEVYNHPKNQFVAGFIGSPAMNFFETHILEESGELYLQGETFKLLIPKNLQQRYRPAKDQTVIWGIRPEHIYDKEITDSIPGGESMRATVELVEPVGSEVILLLSSGSDQFSACVDPKTKARMHDEIELTVDMNHMHLFSKSTGEAL